MLISHSPLKSGGAEKCLIEYSGVLNQAGHDCVVVLPARGELSTELSKVGIKWAVAEYVWATKPRKVSDYSAATLSAGRSMSSIFGLVKKYKPDIIITNTMVIPWGIYVGRSLGIPTALLVHETLVDKLDVLNVAPDYEGYVDAIDRSVDYVIYNSIFTKSSYSDSIKTPVISSNALYPIPKIDEALDRLHTPNLIGDTVKIAVIGSIQKLKNQLEVVLAAKELVKSGVKNFEINMYGDHDPAYIEKVKAAITKNKLDKYVYIKGYTDDVYREINDHNVIVSPFLVESFGRVVLEGQLFGRIVIANDTGAGPELVKNMHNGLVYRSGDHKELSKKIEWVIKNKKKAIKLGEIAMVEQRDKYLSKDRYKPLLDLVKYFSSNKNKKGNRENIYDPVLSLGLYAQTLDKKYRHIHRLTHNKVTRTVLHHIRSARRKIYYKFK